jgi:caa(3)-type oxidase subunit IV
LATSRTQRDARILAVVWLALMAFTLATWRIAEGGSWTGARAAALILGIAVAKCHLIAGVFMELRTAPRVWAVLMSFYLLALGGGLLALLR